jgi:hypothetical protein
MLTNFATASRHSLLVATTLCAAACAELGPDTSMTEDNALASYNGVSYNGVSYNGVSYNGVSYNGFSLNGVSYNGLNYNGVSYNGVSYNGVSFNGLSTSGALSTTSGLMTTEGGREFVKYLVKIAYPAGHSLTKQDQYGRSYTFDGSLGIAPEAEGGVCDIDCQERISGAMLAHVNNSGLHVGIWLVGPDAGVGWGSSPDYPFQEAAYFGNLFAQNMPGNYCSGKNMAAGDSKGRLGSPFGNNSAIMNAPYGWQWDNAGQQNVPSYCVNPQNASLGCTVQNEGFSSCADPFTAGHVWRHPVTVYRNFEPTMLYKICNKNSGGTKCLGVVGGSTASGANVEQRGYTGGAGQTWVIAQVAPGSYKIINKTSGMSLDVNGPQVVQKPYTNQQFPISYVVSQPGYANLKLANTSAAFWTNWSTTDGTLINTVTGQDIADSALWSFTAIGPIAIDPGRTYSLVPQHAPTKAIDVANGSTATGTAVQLYDAWGGDSQKLFVADAAKGNVKLTMKMNRIKCLGPRGGATVTGTKLEVQDCNGGNAQAWISGETAQGSGIFMFKNVAAPGLCLDVTGGSSSNGTTIGLMPCSGANNQLFAARLAP